MVQGTPTRHHRSVMRFSRTSALVLLLALVAVPGTALARRAAIVSDMEAPPHGSGMGAVARPPPPPGPQWLSQADLAIAMRGLRPQIEQCMTDAHRDGTARVTVRIHRSHVLDVDVRAPGDDVAIRQCIELVVQRQLTLYAQMDVRRDLRTSVSVRHREPRAPRAPRVPAPPPPAPPAPTGVEAQVHTAIDRDGLALWSCLTAGGADPSGTATLDVTLGPDGALALTGAGLPTGVVAAPALACLSARITQMRFSPAPARAVAIHHVLASSP